MSGRAEGRLAGRLVVWGLLGLSYASIVWALSSPAPERPSPSVSPPRLVYPDAEVPVASHERATAPEVLSTAGSIRPSWNLGLKLGETRTGSVWARHRALIAVDDEDYRTYAIGDLLPHGAVLVGVSSGAVELMVADVELVHLDVDGEVRSVQDFRSAYEPAPLRVARRGKAKSAEYAAAILEVLSYLRSEDPKEVQGAIDALIAEGAPVVGAIIPYAESTLPVATATYAFATSEPRQPRVYGDLVVGILQAVTGHSFGDPMAPNSSESDRAWIREQWLRWWGLSVEEGDR